MRRLLLAGLALVPVVLLGGCASADGPAGEPPVSVLPADATVVYAFRDSSVPPQYHRSVTLTVTADEARIVIDSYGDVLADERMSTPAAVWQQLGDTLPAIEALEVTDPGEGCVGGTSVEVTVSTPQDVLLSLDPQFCGGSNDGLEEPIEAWIAPARDLFPSTDVLAPEGE